MVPGKGSNTVFDDDGFGGIVVLNRLGGNFKRCTPSTTSASSLNNVIIEVGSAYPLVQLSKRTCREGLSGLEFGIGIPGTVGGAVYGNAGAHAQDMAGVVHQMRILDCSSLEWRTVQRGEVQFQYRRLCVPGLTRPFIASVQLRLQHDAHAGRTAQRNMASRAASQPIRLPSAGCVFRNPSTADGTMLPASLLIDRAGLKGERCGAFMVSELHAGYIVVQPGLPHVQRRSLDLRELIRRIQQRVQQVHGVTLTEEVVIVPNPTAHMP